MLKTGDSAILDFFNKSQWGAQAHPEGMIIRNKGDGGEIHLHPRSNGWLTLRDKSGKETALNAADNHSYIPLLIHPTPSTPETPKPMTPTQFRNLKKGGQVIYNGGSQYQFTQRLKKGNTYTYTGDTGCVCPPEGNTTGYQLKGEMKDGSTSYYIPDTDAPYFTAIKQPPHTCKLTPSTLKKGDTIQATKKSTRTHIHPIKKGDKFKVEGVDGSDLPVWGMKVNPKGQEIGWTAAFTADELAECFKRVETKSLTVNPELAEHFEKA